MKFAAILSISFLVTACNPEEYFPTQEFVQGVDTYCSAAQDRLSCQELGERCMGAFLDLDKDDQEPVFAACIANPMHPDNIPVVDPENPGEEPQDTPPTLNEAIAKKCENIPAQFMYVKEVVSKKKSEIVKKVKLCHSTDKDEHTILIACPALKAHSKHHDGEDYIGACRQ